MTDKDYQRKIVARFMAPQERLHSRWNESFYGRVLAKRDNDACIVLCPRYTA
ncbi:MAG: hypothetical protein JSV97_04955 [candidate division WOR-3 bacterium]|nr:MAG: hypothetical protein JSV97_04955 [candidate division WOR-3 bacterium]